ncbi:hypothetical protein EVAR_54741_1 [Eumeta japonica]|uniref:Uncharacterized protein n=1 Tax=Eumeta variegata TaxID=151549 RepID=A0A4C1YZI3_EUMVA|nr:hypothetical protein EVAR_54741_1 [Eumeta japonica]
MEPKKLLRKVVVQKWNDENLIHIKLKYDIMDESEELPLMVLGRRVAGAHESIRLDGVGSNERRPRIAVAPLRRRTARRPLARLALEHAPHYKFPFRLFCLSHFETAIRTGFESPDMDYAHGDRSFMRMSGGGS